MQAKNTKAVSHLACVLAWTCSVLPDFCRFFFFLFLNPTAWRCRQHQQYTWLLADRTMTQHKACHDACSIFEDDLKCLLV